MNDQNLLNISDNMATRLCNTAAFLTSAGSYAANTFMYPTISENYNFVFEALSTISFTGIPSIVAGFAASTIIEKAVTGKEFTLDIDPFASIGGPPIAAAALAGFFALSATEVIDFAEKSADHAPETSTSPLMRLETV